MSTINVTARQWSGGWELEIDEDHATQVRILANAKQQVINYLDTIEPDVDHTETEVHITPELGELAPKIKESKEATARAIELQAEAGSKNREIVRELRAKHLSVSDVAAVLEISRGRVTQLEHAQE